MIPDAVFKYMEFYIFFFTALTALCYLGLNNLIAVSNPSMVAPTLTTLSTSGSWTDVFITVFNIFIWFVQNIAFLFTLSFSNPFTSFTLIGYLFTFMTTIFALCVIALIRG